MRIARAIKTGILLIAFVLAAGLFPGVGLADQHEAASDHGKSTAAEAKMQGDAMVKSGHDTAAEASGKVMDETDEAASKAEKEAAQAEKNAVKAEKQAAKAEKKAAKAEKKAEKQAIKQANKAEKKTGEMSEQAKEDAEDHTDAATEMADKAPKDAKSMMGEVAAPE